MTSAKCTKSDLSVSERDADAWEKSRSFHTIPAWNKHINFSLNIATERCQPATAAAL